MIAGLSLLLLFNVDNMMSQRTQNKDIAYINVDGFEVKGAWEIHFSKFRSLSWRPEDKERVPNKRWIKWIKSDAKKPGFARKYIVPPGVYRSPRLKDELTILSIRAAWDRKDQNWLALMPNNKRLSKQRMGKTGALVHKRYTKNELSGKQYIILPGRTHTIYTFLWGMGYNYRIEVHVQDYEGDYYIIQGGYLNFYGWRNISFKVPKYIKQESRHLPRVRPMKFVQYKIVADADELNTGFYTYIDYLHTRTDVYEKNFFGSRLTRDDYYRDEEDKSKDKDKK